MFIGGDIEATAKVDTLSTVFIYSAGVIGVVFSFFLYRLVASIKLNDSSELSEGLLESSEESREKIIKIYKAIQKGADSFLFAEYKICLYFIALFSVLLFFLSSRTTEQVCEDECVSKVKFDGTVGALTTLSFIIGAVTSIISGYLGMSIAVFSNARTTISAMTGDESSAKAEKDAWRNSFNTAFRAGGVMGFSLCGIGLIVLYSLIIAYHGIFELDTKKLFECVAGFG